VQEASTGEWVSVDEAAKRLKVAPATIRRQLKRGQLQGKQVPRPYGFSWVIWVDDRLDSGQSGESLSTPRIDKERDTLILDLTHQISQLSGQLGFVQAQFVQTQAQLQAAHQEILALRAPEKEPETAEESPAYAEPRRSWWRFW
jgi:hypothetical protein